MPQATPNSAATWATECPSCPTRRHASTRARSVSDARGRIAGDVSDQVTTGQRGSRHRQTRLTHTNVTGRPAAGRSRTHVGRRSCSRACTPQPRQKSSRAVVSTACSSSPFCCDTASRTNPSNPSIAVAALTSSCTWGLLDSCPHTTNREAPGPFPGSGRSSCHHRVTTLH